MLHSIDPFKTREILLRELEENRGNVKKNGKAVQYDTASGTEVEGSSAKEDCDHS